MAGNSLRIDRFGEGRGPPVLFCLLRRSWLSCCESGGFVAVASFACREVFLSLCQLLGEGVFSLIPWGGEGGLLFLGYGENETSSLT